MMVCKYAPLAVPTRMWKPARLVSGVPSALAVGAIHANVIAPMAGAGVIGVGVGVGAIAVVGVMVAVVVVVVVPGVDAALPISQCLTTP